MARSFSGIWVLSAVVAAGCSSDERPTSHAHGGDAGAEMPNSGGSQASGGAAGSASPGGSGGAGGRSATGGGPASDGGPSRSEGLSSKHPGDVGIASDPDVVFADDF